MASGGPDNIIIIPVPESRFSDVLNHVTPIFLRDEPLSHCFPPCTTGRRERDFREYATSQLESGLCVAAIERPQDFTGSDQELALTGRVVGSCLNRVLTKSKILEYDAELKNKPQSDDIDPLNINVLTLITGVHIKLDLFTALSVDQILEIGLASVEPTHVGRGLATRMMRTSLELGAMKGFRAAKADATGTASAKACQRAGLTPIYRLEYKDFKINGWVPFANPPGNNTALQVLAATLQPTPPYVLPLNNLKSKV